MTGKLRTIDRDLYVPRCVRCGYDGALLTERSVRCAGCGCDLRRRPARSYAEMEGFVTARPVGARVGARFEEPVPAPAPRLHGWLTFLAMLGVGLLMLTYLVAAAMP